MPRSLPRGAVGASGNSGASAAFARFPCPDCGRQVASLYREPIYWSLPDEHGRRHEYAYLRHHSRPDGFPCPQTTTGDLATRLRP